MSGGAPALTIYPHPQQSDFGDFNVGLAASPAIVGGDAADPEALRLLKESLGGIRGDGAIVRILIGERGDPAVAAYLEGLPEKPGAYRILSGANQLVIVGHDGRGTYYGVQTLRQLLEAGGKAGSLPTGSLTDWPDVAYRGVVEGFYGTPWSHESRLSLIRFFGKHKLDTYIYGPKDDPFHSAPNWRKPYPAEDAARIRELVAACQANKVDFVWAIHPGGDIKWNEEDYKNVLAKFEAMYALGVRSYAVFFDDISGEGTKADKQAELLNRLHNDFVVKKGDVTPLVMCPTQYNKAWSGGDYLDVLGQTLDPAIHVMWTGNSVVADLDRPSMEWINTRLRRNAYIWWNYPVSDFVRNHLLLGPSYGNGTDIGELLGGFVSNPMERSEASKVALFGVADYSWNLKSYDADAAWRAGIREVMPRAAEAYEVFSSHNSDLGKNYHGYRRKESVAFGEHAESYLKALREESPADPSWVRAELERIRLAPAAIRSGSDNPSLITEISPWLDAFEQLGTAGVNTVDAQTAFAAGKADEAWKFLAIAQGAMSRLEEINNTQNRNPYQPGVRTGSLVVTPLVTELIDTVSSRLFSKLSGRPIFRPSGITSSKDVESLPLMLDGKEETFFYCKEIQKAGDWYGLDLGGVHEVRRVRIVQGRKDGDHDRVYTGVLETSADGKRWQEVAGVTQFDETTEVAIEPPRQIRQVRVRVTKAGKADGTKNDVWTAFRQFEVNPKEAASLRTDQPVFAALPVRANGEVTSISPAFEVQAFQPGKMLGLLFPESAGIKRVEVDLKVENPLQQLVLEGNTDGNSWQPLEAKAEGTLLVAEPNRSHRAVRVRNTSGKALQVTLAKFAVTTAQAEAANPSAALTDGQSGTRVTLEGSASATVAVSKDSSGAYVLLGRGAEAGVKVTAVSGQQSRPLGVFKGAVVRLPLTGGVTAVTLSAADGNSQVDVHEVLPLSK
jgi:hyaluronoglucosaminidase